MNRKKKRSTFKNPAPFAPFFTQFAKRTGTNQFGKLPIRALWLSKYLGPLIVDAEGNWPKIY